jgi:hypothetical protein
MLAGIERNKTDMMKSVNKAIDAHKDEYLATIAAYASKYCNGNMEQAADKVRGGIIEAVKKRFVPNLSGSDFVLEGGVWDSIIGKLMRWGTNLASGVKEGEFHPNQAFDEALQKYGEKAGLWANLGKEAVSLSLDMPFMGAALKGASFVTNPFFKLGGSALAKGLPKSVKYFKEVIENAPAAGRAMQMTKAGRFIVGGVQQGLAGSIYSGADALLSQKAAGQDLDWAKAFEASKEGSASWALMSTVPYVGNYVNRVIERAIPGIGKAATASRNVMKAFNEFGVVPAAMTAAMIGPGGDFSSPNIASSYLMSLFFAGKGMYDRGTYVGRDGREHKNIVVGASRIFTMNPMQKADFGFTKEELKSLNATSTFNLFRRIVNGEKIPREELMPDYKAGESSSTSVGDYSKSRSEMWEKVKDISDKGIFKELYELLGNPNIPFSAKDKLCYVFTGVHTQRPTILGLRQIDNEDGTQSIYTVDCNDMPIDRFDFKEGKDGNLGGEAKNTFRRLANIVLHNQINVLEKKINGNLMANAFTKAMQDLSASTGGRKYAAEFSEEMKRLSDKLSRGEKLTADERKEYNQMHRQVEHEMNAAMESSIVSIRKQIADAYGISLSDFENILGRNSLNDGERSMVQKYYTQLNREIGAPTSEFGGQPRETRKTQPTEPNVEPEQGKTDTAKQEKEEPVKPSDVGANVDDYKELTKDAEANPEDPEVQEAVNALEEQRKAALDYFNNGEKGEAPTNYDYWKQRMRLGEEVDEPTQPEQKVEPEQPTKQAQPEETKPEQPKQQTPEEPKQPKEPSRKPEQPAVMPAGLRVRKSDLMKITQIKGYATGTYPSEIKVVGVDNITEDAETGGVTADVTFEYPTKAGADGKKGTARVTKRVALVRLGQVPYKTEQTKHGVLSYYLDTVINEDGTKVTSVRVELGGQEVLSPNAYFPMPEGYEADPEYLEESDGEVLGIHKLREAKDGRKVAEVMVKDEIGLNKLIVKLRPVEPKQKASEQPEQPKEIVPDVTQEGTASEQHEAGGGGKPDVEAIKEKIAEIKGLDKLWKPLKSHNTEEAKSINGKLRKAKSELRSLLMKMSLAQLEELEDKEGEWEGTSLGYRSARDVFNDVLTYKQGEARMEERVEESKQIEPKKPQKKVVPMDFSYVDYGQKSGMNYAVYHEGGFVVGTNNHIIYGRREDYPTELEGKMTDKKGRITGGSMPMPWREVFPEDEQTEPLEVDIDGLHRFVAGVRVTDKSEYAHVGIKLPDGRILFYNAKGLDLFLRAARASGAEVMLTGEDAGYKRDSLSFHTDDAAGMIMASNKDAIYSSCVDNAWVYDASGAGTKGDGQDRPIAKENGTEDSEQPAAPEKPAEPAAPEKPAEPARPEEKEAKPVRYGSGGYTLRPARQEDFEGRHTPLYVDGKQVHAVIFIRTGEQVSAAQFSSPRVEAIVTTTDEWIPVERLEVEDVPKTVHLKTSDNFYVAYGNEAVALGRATGMTIIENGGHKTAGFPKDYLDEVEQKLRDAGFDVSVDGKSTKQGESTEQPKQEEKKQADERNAEENASPQQEKPAKGSKSKEKPVSLQEQGVKPSAVSPEGEKPVKERPSKELIGDSDKFQKQAKSEQDFVGRIKGMIADAAKEGKSLTMADIKRAYEEERGRNSDLPSDYRDTDLQELVERAMTLATRDIAVESLSKNTPEAVRDGYDRIVQLYNSQPSLNSRDSSRMEHQQYSTPTPFAYLMDWFLRNGKTPHSGLEPSAGNGALTIGFPASIWHVNDIDERRLMNLRTMPYGKITNQDGTMPFEPKAYDMVATNPPFGTTTEKTFDGGKTKINSLEGLMAINALLSMKDDGRAAIIIGGNTSYMSNGAMQSKDMKLFRHLYTHYNVVDVINLNGDMYKRNGTGYDVRIILIDGRKTDVPDNPEKFTYPPVRDKARAEQVRTFDELYKRIEDDIQHSLSQRLQSESPDTEHRVGGESGHRIENRPEDNRQRPVSDEQPVRGRPMGGSPQPAISSADAEDGGRTGVGGEQAQISGVDNDDRRNELGAGGVRPGEPTKERGASNRGGIGGDNRTGIPNNDNSNGRGLAVSEPQKKLNGNEDKAVGLGQEKVSYRPKSKSITFQSQVPAEQAEAIESNLDKIGDVDDFLTKELGYSSKDELFSHLSAEQIDGVALAINQMRAGKGFIIGDMTGIGKGRQGAALIRWAINQGKTPIYFTQKARLFTDNYRDMCDIGSKGLRPFIMSSNKEAPITEIVVDKNGEVVYDDKGKVKTRVVYGIPTKQENERVYKYVLDNGKLPPEYDYVLVTYSQVSTGTTEYVDDGKGKIKKKTKKSKGKTSQSEINGDIRRNVIEKLSANNYILLDESHTVGGQSSVGYYMQDILKNVAGVTYMSATFAKRPDNMPLYAMKTAMSESGLSQNKMIEAIQKGGVTLQEVMSKQLSQSGQMIRRERDFSGVSIDWEGVDPQTDKKQRAQFDEVSKLFNEIKDFQDTYVDPYINEVSNELATTGSYAVRTRGTSHLGVSNVPFASKMFNLVNQLLFALKVDAVADRAIAALKENQKPVISFTNTMEGFLKELPKGEQMEEAPDFSMTLMRALEGTLKYSEGDAASGEEQKKMLSLSELGKEAQDKYNEIRRHILGLGAGLPIDPLDAIKMKIEDAGYKVGEISGREIEIVRDGEGKYVVQPRSGKDSKAVANAFNNGGIDVVFVNKSGSTGISLHASSKFGDTRQRIMIAAQFQMDINDEVQMRGRIDRTGQVQRGRYVYIMSSIPAEQRLQMMFKNKLKSLDANTTSSQKSKFNEMEVTDFMNKYGDKIVWDYMQEHPELEDRLGDPLKMFDTNGNVKEDNGSAKDDKVAPDSAAIILRRLPFLSVAEQESIFNDISEAYAVKMKLLDDAGENDLEITTMPLRAKTESKSLWVHGTNPGSGNSFADNTYLEKVEVDVLKKPMKAKEVKEYVERLTGGEDWLTWHASKHEEIAKYFDEKRKAVSDKMSAAMKNKAEKKRAEFIKGAIKVREKEGSGITDEEISRAAEKAVNDYISREQAKIDKRLNDISKQENRIYETFDYFKPYEAYVIPLNLTDRQGSLVMPSTGTFIGIKFNKSYSLSSSTAVFATLDGRRKVELPLNDEDSLSNIRKQSIMMSYEKRGLNMDNWDSRVPTNSRKTAYIVTGNLMQALVDTQKDNKTKGQLISYTTIDGEVKQGILMNSRFKEEDLYISVPIYTQREEIKQGDLVESEDGEVSIGRSYNGIGGVFKLSVPKSKAKGGKYFLDKKLRGMIQSGEFETRGNKMVGWITEDKLDDVLVYLSKSLGVKVKQNTSYGDGGHSYSNKTGMHESLSKVAGEVKLVSEEESRLRDAVIDLEREAGLDVIDDMEEGQRVLDMANGESKDTTGLAERQEVNTSVQHGNGVRFFRTSSGEAYGFTVGGKIYIDPRIATSETPIHEYAHLWAEALRKANPKEWQNAVELMKECKTVWEQVKKEYPELKTDDEIADEVLAHYSGQRGAERLRAEADKATNAAKGMIAKAEVINVFNKLREAIKRAWKHIAEDILHIHFTSAEEVADKVMYDLLRGFDPRKVKSENGEVTSSEDYVRLSRVTDRREVDRLEHEPKIKTYRAMQVVDGKLYPPMAAKVGGNMVEPTKLGQWEKADEHPELVDKNGKFVLDKGTKDANGKSQTKVPAAYNPYIHSSLTPLNDQFATAYKRPNLVTVEMEVPESELTSGYHAEGAKDAVGMHRWKAGEVQRVLTGMREVMLSRWAKPVRIVPDAEVARIIKRQVGDVPIPENTVTPSLKAELEKAGVKVVPLEEFRRLYPSKSKKAGMSDNDTRGYTTTGSEGAGSGHAERADVEQAVADVDKRTGGNTAVIDSSEVPADVVKKLGEGVKGYVKGGKAYVVADNCDSAAEAATVAVHESAGHINMRDYLGDKAGEFYQSVFDNVMSDADRAAWKQATKGESDTEAAEEFVADQARLAATGKPSIWSRIVGRFREFLWRHFGIHPSLKTVDYMLWKATQQARGRDHGVLYENENMFRDKARGEYTSEAQRKIADAEEIRGYTEARSEEQYAADFNNFMGERKVGNEEEIDKLADELSRLKQEKREMTQNAISGHSVYTGDDFKRKRLEIRLAEAQKKELEAENNLLDKLLGVEGDTRRRARGGAGSLYDATSKDERQPLDVSLAAADANILKAKLEAEMFAKEHPAEGMSEVEKRHYENLLAEQSIAKLRKQQIEMTPPVLEQPEMPKGAPKYPTFDRDENNPEVYEKAIEKYNQEKKEYEDKLAEYDDAMYENDEKFKEWKIEQGKIAAKITALRLGNKLDEAKEHFAQNWAKPGEREGLYESLSAITGIDLTGKGKNIKHVINDFYITRRKLLNRRNAEDERIIGEVERAVREFVGNRIKRGLQAAGRKIGGIVAPEKTRPTGASLNSVAEVNRALIDMVEGTMETPEELKPVVEKIRHYFDDVFNWLAEEGMANPYQRRKNYVPHVWDMEKSDISRDLLTKLQGMEAAEIQRRYEGMTNDEAEAQIKMLNTQLRRIKLDYDSLKARRSGYEKGMSEYNELSDQMKAVIDDLNRVKRQMSELRRYIGMQNLRLRINSKLYEGDEATEVQDWLTTRSRFMQERELDSYAEGIRGGLVPKYDSITDLMRYYGGQSNQAVANRGLIDLLKNVNYVDANGGKHPLIKEIDDRPTEGYVTLPNKALHGYEVLAGPNNRYLGYLNVLFGSKRIFGSSGDWLQSIGAAVDVLNSIAKTGQLTLSGFHHIALSEGFLGMSHGHGLPWLSVSKGADGKHKIRFTAGGPIEEIYGMVIKTIATGELPSTRMPELVDDAVYHLVKLGATGDYNAKETASILQNLADKFGNMASAEWKAIVNSRNEQEYSNSVAKFIDKIGVKRLHKYLSIGAHAGRTAVSTLNSALEINNWILWDLVHDSVKLMAYRDRAAQIRKQAEAQGWTQKELDGVLDELGQFINDTFGGQNWETMMASKKVLRAFQFTFLSPDWNFSAMRHFSSLVGGGRLYNYDPWYKHVSEVSMLRLKKMLAGQSPFKSAHSLGADMGAVTRKSLGRTCIAASAFLLSAAYSFMQLYNRYKDEQRAAKQEDNPYKEAYGDDWKPLDLSTKEGWYDALSRGDEWIVYPWNTMNAPGRSTYLFLGRGDDGTERYMRWGKQYREIFDLLISEAGAFDPFTGINKIIGKTSPVLQFVPNVLTGRSLTADDWADNKDITEADNWKDATTSRLTAMAQMFSPYSLRQKNKGFVVAQLMMPVSKGLTIGKAVPLLVKAIDSGDMRLVERVRRSVYLSGLDYKKVQDMANMQVETRRTEEIKKSIGSPEQALIEWQKSKAKGDTKGMEKYENMYKRLTDTAHTVVSEREALEDAKRILKGDYAEGQQKLYDSLKGVEDVREDTRLSRLKSNLQVKYEQAIPFVKEIERMVEDDNVSYSTYKAYQRAHRADFISYLRYQNVKAISDRISRVKSYMKQTSEGKIEKFTKTGKLSTRYFPKDKGMAEIRRLRKMALTGQEYDAETYDSPYLNE